MKGKPIVLSGLVLCQAVSLVPEKQVSVPPSLRVLAFLLHSVDIWA